MTEYAMVAGLIAVASIGAVVATGTETRDIFCTAANTLASASGRNFADDCPVDGMAGLPELPSGERYVDTPVAMVADFQNIEFENPETGERLVMASIEGGAASRFWFDAEITSREAYEPQRAISACYMAAGITYPICSQPSDLATIQVAPGAGAFGYQVSLNEDTQLPWSNDVSLTALASAETPAQSWDVVVSRTDAPPVRDVSFEMVEAYDFEQTDAGTMYVPFADLEGSYNIPVWFHVAMSKESNVLLARTACYKMTPESEPICGAMMNNTNAKVQVPVGAAQVGFTLNLPGATTGTDWIRTFPVSLRVGDDKSDAEIYSQEIVVTRPNEPIVRDVSFEMVETYDFEQTDTGTHYIPFANLDGEHNVPVWFHVGRQTQDAAYLMRTACYRMTPEGDPVCGKPMNNTISTVQVPVGASQIGFSLDLPETTLGNDWIKTFPVSLRIGEADGSTVLDGQSITVTRPNEPVVRDVTFDMVDAYSFGATDTGTKYVPFASLEGNYNVPVWFHVGRQTQDTAYLMRTACYRMTPESDPVCGAPMNNVPASVQVPVGASEVGFSLALPDTYAGNDWVRTFPLQLRMGEDKYSQIIYGHTIDVTRPNPEISRNASFDMPDYTLAYDHPGGFTELPFVDIEGDFNVPIWAHVSRQHENSDYQQRLVCYKMTPESTAVCDAGYTNTANKTKIPVGAAQIGIKMGGVPTGQLASDWYRTVTVSLRVGSGAGSELIDGNDVRVTKSAAPAAP